MNDSEHLNAAPNFDPQEPDLQTQVESLRKLFVTALVALLIMGISLNVFLLRQTAFVRRDLQKARPQVTQLLVNFEKSEEPQINRFVNALIAYSRTHADFRPILAKYNIATGAPTNAAPASNPAPSPAPAPAKKK